MAVTTSPRLGITRWSADSDPLNRVQFDTDHSLLDTLTAIDVQDILANRPAPGVRGRFFTQTDGLAGVTWREDGSSWRSVGSRITPVSSTDVGVIVRGAPSQSGDLKQYQNSAGSVLASVDAGGGFNGTWGSFGTGAAIGVSNAGGFGASLVASPNNTSRSAAIFKGIASQLGAITEWQDSAGTPTFSVDAALNLQYGAFNNGNTGGAHVNIGNKSGDLGSVEMLIRASSGQTADLVQAKTFAGANIWRIRPNDISTSAFTPGVGTINNWGGGSWNTGYYRVQDGWCTVTAWTSTNTAATYADPLAPFLPVVPNSNTTNSGSLLALSNGAQLSTVLGTFNYRRNSDGATFTGLILWAAPASGGAGTITMASGGGLFSIQPGANDMLTYNLSYPV